MICGSHLASPEQDRAVSLGWLCLLIGSSPALRDARYRAPVIGSASDNNVIHKSPSRGRSFAANRKFVSPQHIRGFQNTNIMM